MNTNLNRTLIVAFVAAVSLALVAAASAQSYLDGSSKTRGDYGQMPRISRSVGQPTFQASAPSVQRSYSYEPAPAVKTDKTDKSSNAKSNVSPKATDNSSAKAKDNANAKAAPSAKDNAAPSTTARRDSQSTRSYSYEPSMGAQTAPAGRSQTPLYLVPKTLR